MNRCGKKEEAAATGVLLSGIWPSSADSSAMHEGGRKGKKKERRGITSVLSSGSGGERGGGESDPPRREVTARFKPSIPWQKKEERKRKNSLDEAQALAHGEERGKWMARWPGSINSLSLPRKREEFVAGFLIGGRGEGGERRQTHREYKWATDW